MELKKSKKERKCPKCSGNLTPLKYRKYKCESCGAMYKLKYKNTVNSYDTSKWKATCQECGGKMDYYNFKYGCRKCGNILEV